MKINKIYKKYHRLIILGFILLLIAILITSIMTSINSKKKLSADPLNSNVFFLQNKENRYALFNENGKQLTKFIYTSVGNFHNNAVKVRDEAGKMGILNSKGKYISKLGKYETIISYNGLFKVSANDDLYNLINVNNKKIISSKVFDVILPASVDLFIITTEEKGYGVYNYLGEKIYFFKTKIDENIPVPTANQLGNYGSVYFNGETIIFNAKTTKIINKIKDNTHYCLSNISSNEDTMILNSCTNWQEIDNTTYKLLVNGKEKKLDSCDSLSLDNDNLVCSTKNSNHLLNSKYKPIDDELEDMSFQNFKNYAVQKDKNIEFIKNGKVVSKLDGATLADKGYTKKNIYLVYKNGEYQYYDINGKSLFAKTFKRAYAFDSNDLAKVSDGDDYYFINTKGKKVSDFFASSYQSGVYYIVSTDNQKGLIDSKGATILKPQYQNLTIHTHDEEDYAYIKNDNKFEVINLHTNKTILSLDKEIIFNDHYLKVTNASNITYYTYTGKKIYEEEA